jgi:hypothetical protein
MAKSHSKPVPSRTNADGMGQLFFTPSKVVSPPPNHPTETIMLNTITSRITQLLDVILPAAMSAGFLSVLVYMAGNAVGVLA